MIQPEDFQRLAETWIQGADEAEWRSAVSRAYYAAFHKARRLFIALGFQPPKGDQAHAYLWLRLLNCGDPQVQLAGSDLNTLRRDRNLADYGVDQNLSQTDGLIQVQSARQIIQVLYAAASEPTRTQITDAMKIYETNILRQVTWKP
jgi:uncharacterized protein (UPF0332 family)